MKIDAFEKCTKLLSYWKYEDDEVWKILTGISVNVDEQYVRPFKLELLMNLASSESSQGKADVIKYYLIVMKGVINIPEDFQGLINSDSAEIQTFPEVDNSFGIIQCTKYSINPENDSVYAVHGQFSHIILRNSLLMEIQDTCIQFKIPFIEICNDIEFPSHAIGFLDPRIVESVQPKEKNNTRPSFLLPQLIRNKMNSFNFMELKLVKRLSPFALEKLYELLATNNTPYQIALLDFLGFIRHYERNFATTRKDLYDALADILSTSNRTVQGNINVLMPSSKADKERFTAHNFKEKVEKDYQNLD